MQKIGNAVSSAGRAVTSLNTGALAPLAVVTNPVGAIVSGLGTGVTQTGSNLGAALSSAPVQQLTQGVTTAITPITTLRHVDDADGPARRWA